LKQLASLPNLLTASAPVPLFRMSLPAVLFIALLKPRPSAPGLFRAFASGPTSEPAARAADVGHDRIGAAHGPVTTSPVLSTK
jgi:hypothetical protein